MKPRVWLGASWAAWRHGIIAGTILAALGSWLCALPQSWPLQESVDLWILFRLRAPQLPPPDVVLVAIDPLSAERLSLPRDPAARDKCADLRIGPVPASHELLPACTSGRALAALHACSRRTRTRASRCARDRIGHLVSPAARQRLRQRCTLRAATRSHARRSDRRRAQRPVRTVARSCRGRFEHPSAGTGQLGHRRPLHSALRRCD
jgi:hypothetical protein